jgi:hypothetical protein
VTAKRRKSVTVLKWVNLSTLFVALIFPLFLCLSVAFNDGRKPTWLHFLPIPTALLVLGVAVLITRGLFLLVDREHQEWWDFVAEFKFIVLLSGTGWSLGAGVASLMAALYFTLPDARPHERFDVGFGVYFSIIGLTLAIHAFYRQYAPITNLDFLLLRLIDDLKGKDNPVMVK